MSCPSPVDMFENLQYVVHAGVFAALVSPCSLVVLRNTRNMFTVCVPERGCAAAMQHVVVATSYKCKCRRDSGLLAVLSIVVLQEIIRSSLARREGEI